MPITAWRIVKARHAATAFLGEGARWFGGRWNSPGTPAVYTSESRALSLLEVLAGLQSPHAMQEYVLIPALFDEALVTDLNPSRLPRGWRRSPPPSATQRIGDEWVTGLRSAVLRLPSVIVPEENNYLLNPEHPDFERIEIGEPVAVVIDPRLLG